MQSFIEIHEKTHWTGFENDGAFRANFLAAVAADAGIIVELWQSLGFARAEEGAGGADFDTLVATNTRLWPDNRLFDKKIFENGMLGRPTGQIRGLAGLGRHKIFDREISETIPEERHGFNLVAAKLTLGADPAGWHVLGIEPDNPANQAIEGNGIETGHDRSDMMRFARGAGAFPL